MTLEVSSINTFKRIFNMFLVKQIRRFTQSWHSVGLFFDKLRRWIYVFYLGSLALLRYLPNFHLFYHQWCLYFEQLFERWGIYMDVLIDIFMIFIVSGRLALVMQYLFVFYKLSLFSYRSTLWCLFTFKNHLMHGFEGGIGVSIELIKLILLFIKN